MFVAKTYGLCMCVLFDDYTRRPGKMWKLRWKNKINKKTNKQKGQVYKQFSPSPEIPQDP